MYEGQTLVGQKIIEENWLEYLAFVKKKANEDEELNRKRAEALKDFDSAVNGNLATVPMEKPQVADYRWYDTSIQSFWNWYISNRIG